MFCSPWDSEVLRQLAVLVENLLTDGLEQMHRYTDMKFHNNSCGIHLLSVPFLRELKFASKISGAKGRFYTKHNIKTGIFCLNT